MAEPCSYEDVFERMDKAHTALRSAWARFEIGSANGPIRITDAKRKFYQEIFSDAKRKVKVLRFFMRDQATRERRRKSKQATL